MLFIVHPNYEQDRLDAVISAVQKEITSKGAKILKTDNWGKRKLAYLINKQRYGSYVLMYFEADPEMISGLYEWMEIQAQILHQMVIRLDDKPELSEESQNPDTRMSAAPKAATENKVKEAAPAEKAEEAKAEEKAEVVEEPSAEAAADAPEVEEEVEAVEEAPAEEEAADKEGE